MSHVWAAALAAMMLLTLVGFVSVGSEVTSDFHGTKLLESRKDGSEVIRVEPGDANSAQQYYLGITPLLELEVLKSNLQSVLDYMGYRGLLVEIELEEADRQTIMAAFPAGDVLVTRFFAPKITAVATPISDPADQLPPAYFGWRKLVRVQARPGSMAAGSGIATMLVLFNIFQAHDQVADDPFLSNRSASNQVILVRTRPDADGRQAYWLVYGRDHALTDHLCASFDGDAAPPSDPCPDGAKYFVPRACVQCHGGQPGREMLNYLDTDHWHDRVQRGDDFVFLSKKSFQIAALLGHKTLAMTMVYARIADKTVADEYFKVTEKVEALYQQPRQLPATDEGTEMRRLRAEMHRRMLGNGYCTRPVEMDCHFESICESCTFFVTTIAFRPTFQQQRDDAERKGQVGRQKIFDGLLTRLDKQEEAS